MASEAVLYEVSEHVAVITMNRPERRNAINAEMREELFNAFERARDDDEVWAIILTGAGGNFSSGHDLTEMGHRPKPGRTTEDLYLFQLSIYKPIIAAVDGYCLAQGGGLLLCSDVRIAAETARFGWPQVKRGIMSISAPALLAHSVPLPIAMELMLTGEFIDARRALEIGMVNRVVPAEEVQQAAWEVARAICRNAPLAARAIKEASIRGLHLPVWERVRVAADLLDRIMRTEDAQEGLRAFVEKREPVWRGV